MYRLINLNIARYFQTGNMQYTIKNFQKIYLPPLSYKPPSLISPPSRALEINKPPGGLNREFTVWYVMLCYVMLCYVMLCYVVMLLCYVMFYYAMLKIERGNTKDQGEIERTTIIGSEN